MGSLLSSSFISSSSSSSDDDRCSIEPASKASSTRVSLEWSAYKESMQAVSEVRIVSFNLLAPCYKRMPERNVMGRRMRESQQSEVWQARAKKVLDFFRSELLQTTSIIALQEFWLEDEYKHLFEQVFAKYGYELRTLQRTGEKVN